MSIPFLKAIVPSNEDKVLKAGVGILQEEYLKLVQQINVPESPLTQEVGMTKQSHKLTSDDKDDCKHSTPSEMGA